MNPRMGPEPYSRNISTDFRCHHKNYKSPPMQISTLVIIIATIKLFWGSYASSNWITTPSTAINNNTTSIKTRHYPHY